MCLLALLMAADHDKPWQCRCQDHCSICIPFPLCMGSLSFNLGCLLRYFVQLKDLLSFILSGGVGQVAAIRDSPARLIPAPHPAGEVPASHRAAGPTGASHLCPQVGLLLPCPWSPVHHKHTHAQTGNCGHIVGTVYTSNSAEKLLGKFDPQMVLPFVEQ